MSIHKNELQGLTGAAVVGPDGDKIGEVSQFFLSDTTGDPTWATVRTGLFGTKESFVPLGGSSADSGVLRVAFDKATVREAPRVDADSHLTPQEEDDLYRYYGITDDEDYGVRDTRQSGGALGDTESIGDDDRGTRDLDDSRTGNRGDATGITGQPVERRDDVGAGGAGYSTVDRDDLTRRPGRDRDADVERDFDTDRDRDDDVDRDDFSPRADRDRDDEHSSESDTDRGTDVDALKPGETRTRMRRYVVTEHVTQTVEELPDDDDRA